MLSPSLLTAILDGYRLAPHGIHGVSHWARVLENGLRLAQANGADPAVVELFAVFHDARRFNEGRDPGHGRRGGELARTLRGAAFELAEAPFQLLYRACSGHTGGSSDPDITVRTCWDADRLDLGRVGIPPDPRLLCTPAAREREMIAWAYARSIDWLVPDLVGTQWGLDPDGLPLG
jgi:uncharacterized protein